jgi:uncharacterized protein
LTKRATRYGRPSTGGGSALPYLSQIFVYPIKSTRGIEVDQIRVDVSGPMHDRRWMLVDGEGVCLTQRTQPRMALMVPRFEGRHLVVEAPGMQPLRIEEWNGSGERVPVRIWDDDLRLPHPHASYSRWFSDFLGQACRLVHLPDTVVRPVQAPFDRAPWRVSLADSFPILVIGQASLDLLNERLQEPITMARFRPNLVIAGTGAHEEDGWRTVQMGEVKMAIAKACVRCALPLVDPLTAQTGVEPLRTLATYRRKPDSSKVLFGQNALVTQPGVLRAGDAVEVGNNQDSESVTVGKA